MNVCDLQIITPNNILYQGKVKMVEYNTTEGQVGVYPNHIAMTQVVSPGKLTVYEENTDTPLYFSLISGVVQIMPDLITIMAEIIEKKEDIDVDRAEKSKKRAEDRLLQKEENIDFARAEASLMRAIVRIDVAKDQ